MRRAVHGTARRTVQFAYLLSLIACSLGAAVPPSNALGRARSPRSRALLDTGRPRVAVVNDIPGHYEVLAGIIHALRQAGVRPDVLYTGAPVTPLSWGIVPWLKGSAEAGKSAQLEGWPRGQRGDQAVAPRPLETEAAVWYPLQLMVPGTLQNLHVDIVLCVSPELAPSVCRSIVERFQPQQLIIILHRADALTRHAKVLSIYPNRTRMFALAPHVAALSGTKLSQPVQWALPTCPFTPRDTPCMQRACLDGFTIQGALRRYSTKNTTGYTRNYIELWRRLAELRPTHTDKDSQHAPVRVAVLGKGERTALEIPDALADDVSFYSRLAYPDFWERIHHSLALVPSLGHQQYYVSRLTSTVLASLITATPMIVDQRFLSVYTFLEPQHVFIRTQDEHEAAAMYRVASLPESEIISRRQALVALREQCNQQAVDMLKPWIHAA